MHHRRAALALTIALSLVSGGCDATRAPSGPPSVPSPATGSSPSPGASRAPAATPATILAVEPGKRPSGPWAVTFQASGSPAVREVYVLAPACAEPTCDITATIQTYDGISIGTATFRLVDGMYRYEADSRDAIDCEDDFGPVAAGATQVSHTSLVIAGYRPAGTSVVSIDIRGTRSVTIEPKADSSCRAVSIEYVANGEATRFAAAPAPTPKPPSSTQIPGYGSAFFGPGSTVNTYVITGSSIPAIIGSIRANGPWSDWVDARAEAVTRAVPSYRFTLVGAGDACRIKVDTHPAIVFKYTITLPRWSRPKGVDEAVVRWWAAEIERVAVHERHHVELFRAGATRLSSAVGTSTCANVNARLAAIAKDVVVAQCEFDLREYGAALGLNLASCVNQ